MFKIQFSYLIVAIVLLVTEIIIGAFIHDSIIRPFFGDFLVVILLYCLLKSFVKIDTNIAAIGVLLLSYCIETAQFFHVLNMLGLENSAIARILFGTSFSWMDMLMYSLGFLVVWIIEMRIRSVKQIEHVIN